MAEKDDVPHEQPDAATTLQRLVRANACILYYDELPDPEFPAVTCSIYGYPKTNELFVRLSCREISFVASVPSPVSFPPMVDRILGMDAVDQAAAFTLADKLWEDHREALVQASARTPRATG